MGGKPVGYLQSVALVLKTGQPWNESKWSERDLNPGPLDYKSGRPNDYATPPP